MNVLTHRQALHQRRQHPLPNQLGRHWRLLECRGDGTVPPIVEVSAQSKRLAKRHDWLDHH